MVLKLIVMYHNVAYLLDQTALTNPGDGLQLSVCLNYIFSQQVLNNV